MGFASTTANFLFLLSTVLAQSTTSSSPATSPVSAPVCGSTPACTYAIAEDLGAAAVCGSNYCICGGVVAPPMTTIISGNSTVGCNYLTQPASSKCPEDTELTATHTSLSGTSIRAPSNATIITGPTEGGSTVTGTALPTTHTNTSTLSGSTTIAQTEFTSIVTSDSQSSNTSLTLPTPVTSTITVGTTGEVPVSSDGSSRSDSLSHPTGLSSASSTIVSPSTSGGSPSTSSDGPVSSSTIDSVVSSAEHAEPSSTSGSLPPASPSSNSSIVSVSSSTESKIPSVPSVTISPATTWPSVPFVTISPTTTWPTSSDDGLLPLITSFGVDVLTVTSIDPSVSDNTAISTSDGTHPAGLYPFVHGGKSCFFCPPGIDLGGIVLWGMSSPGIYPPPVPPPVPNVPWPTITIGPDHKPTPGPNPESENTENGQSSQTSKSCTTSIASSCAVTCTTSSGQSTASCATKCETSSGCSVTNIATTTTKSASCSPSHWPSGAEDFDGPDGGDEGPDPSYTGSVPAWVTAPPSESGAPDSTTDSGGTPTSSSAPHNFCWAYANPRKNERYCTCSDGRSLAFTQSADCPKTSPASEATPTPTQEPPKTDGNGNIYNSTDMLAGTIWGCKSTSIRKDLGPYPITMCLSSSSIGMAFTPTSEPPASTSSPLNCNIDQCSTDLGASSCDADDNDCLLQECYANPDCKDCPCSIFVTGGSERRRDGHLTGAIISARPIEIFRKLSRRNVIEPTLIERFAALGGHLNKRAQHGSAWNKFAPKGIRYYQMILSNPMEDKIEPKSCELREYFRVRENGPTIARPKGELFKKIGVDPKGTPISEFEEVISAEQGIFFANANDRGERKNENGEIIQQPIPYQMSTIAWWMWKHTVLLHISKQTKVDITEIKEETTDFSNFRYFFRFNIINVETREILEEALGDEKGPKDFTPQDTTPDNAFWPLLGSPNGNGIAWFLADHKKSLKGKTVEKITVWYQEELAYWHMWATIKSL